MAKTMTSQNVVNLSVDGIAASANKAKERGLPPVHLWNPPFCGDLDMQILKDGTWIHEGGKTNRPEMVKLFSSILRKEGESYFLVTPVEKVGIAVEDAPFIATDLSHTGEAENLILTFETHVGDVVIVDQEHPIRVEVNPETNEPAPYVMVRAGLEARIDRKTFYRMVELGCEQDGWFGVYSGGMFFPLIKADQL